MNKILIFSVLIFFFSACKKPPNSPFDIENLYPWCIVAYDSVERSPEQRIQMLMDFGFTKYAYDWRDQHLESTLEELTLALQNNIEISAVWLWLNLKRDSIGKLSQSNAHLLNIIDQLNLHTTIWVGLSESYFKNLTHEESVNIAVK